MFRMNSPRGVLDYRVNPINSLNKTPKTPEESSSNRVVKRIRSELVSAFVHV